MHLEYARPEPALVVVEDSDEDFEALRRALKKSAFGAPVVRHANGSHALEWLRTVARDPSHGPRPGLILLDLNLPGIDGRELLEEIRSDRTLQLLPVVILTTSSNPSDITICYRKGANSYLVKPVDVSLFQNSIKLLCTYWFEIVYLP